MSFKGLFISIFIMVMGAGIFMVPLSLVTVNNSTAKYVVKSKERKNQEKDRTNSANVKCAFDAAIANEDCYDDALTGSIVVCTQKGDIRSDCKGTVLVNEMAFMLEELTPPKSEKNEGLSYYVSWKGDREGIRDVEYGFIKDAFTDNEEIITD